MAERADIFENDDPVDVSDFKPSKPKPGPSADEVKKVAEGTAFRSREPAAVAPAAAPARRERRIHRTGRTELFGCKARPDVVQTFYDISNKQGWVLGETLERAVAALKREMEPK